MKRSLALLKWHLPVIWVAGDGPGAIDSDRRHAIDAEAAPKELTAQPVTVIHYHLHLEAGTDVAEAIRQARLSNPHRGADLPELEA